MNLLYFYIIFSYLVIVGIDITNELPKWNVIFAPIVFPVILGKFMALTIKK